MLPTEKYGEAGSDPVSTAFRSVVQFAPLFHDRAIAIRQPSGSVEFPRTRTSIPSIVSVPGTDRPKVVYCWEAPVLLVA